MTLKLMSRKAYYFVREKKLIPLPGESTLRKYFKNFTINEGYFQSVHQLLKVVSSVLDDQEKLISLSFDEIHLKKTDIRWEQKSDQIIGPNNTANVMMMRCLYYHLKLPIFFQFDTLLDRKNLEIAIKAVEDAGFHVVATCCDISYFFNSHDFFG